MKKLEDFTANDRIENIEILIVQSVISTLILIIIIGKIIPIDWINLILSAVGGLSLGSAFIHLYTTILLVGEGWENNLRGLYNKYSKQINFTTKWIIVVGLIILIVNMLGLTYQYAAGTILFTIIGNYIWERYKGRVEH